MGTVSTILDVLQTVPTSYSAARRKKHEVLNHSMLLYQRTDSGQEGKECEKPSQHLSRYYEDPSDVILEKEVIENINYIVKSSLSALEYKIMTLWTLGYRQPEIASQIGVGIKVVDNAMQRARKKLTNLFRSCDDAMSATQKYGI